MEVKKYRQNLRHIRFMLRCSCIHWFRNATEGKLLGRKILAPYIAFSNFDYCLVIMVQPRTDDIFVHRSLH